MATKRLFRSILFLLPFLSLVMGCANTFNTPFKPAAGWCFTHYTIPLSPEYTGFTLDGTVCESTENFYFCWPNPLFDLAWQDKHINPSRKQKADLKYRVYADVEVLTILGMFGRYKVNIYGQP